MKTQSLSKQWQTRRKRRVLLAVIMLLLLLAATVFFAYARQMYRQSQMEAVISEQAYQEAVWREDEARDVALFNEKAQQMVQAAAAHGLSPDGWAERRINLKQAQISRGEANELLLTVARKDNRLFNVEEFDIAVTRDDEGLFNLSERSNTPLLITVRGTSVFRTGR